MKPKPVGELTVTIEYLEIQDCPRKKPGMWNKKETD